MKEYRDLWAQTMGDMPVTKSFSGKVGHISAGGDEFARLRPRLIQLDSIVTSLEEQTKTALGVCDRVTQAIGPKMKSYFGGRFLSFVPGEDEKPEQVPSSNQ